MFIDDDTWCLAEGIDEDEYYWRCTRPQRAAGYCNGHYQQQRRGRPITKLRKKDRSCGFVGCDARHHANGWCPGHLLQLQEINAGRKQFMTPLTITKPRHVKGGKG